MYICTYRNYSLGWHWKCNLELWDREMEEPPTITVESDTGFGAELFLNETGVNN